jgi:ParB-like nuclease domain
MTMTAAEYQTVPLARLMESEANPRRITSKAADAELADSVKKMGVLEPLLVRIQMQQKVGAPLGADLELIAGHRRLAAARAAGLKEVPVRLLDLDEDQAEEEVDSRRRTHPTTRREAHKQGVEMSNNLSPAALAAGADLVDAYLDSNFPRVSDVGGTLQKVPVVANRNRVEYCLQNGPGVTPKKITDWLNGQLGGMRGQFPPATTPLGPDYTAMWDAVGGKFHWALWTEMQNFCVPAPGHSTGTGAGVPLSEITGGGNHQAAVDAKASNPFFDVNGKPVRNTSGDPANPDPAYIAARDLLFKTHPYTPPVPPGTPAPDPSAPPAVGFPGGAAPKP